MNPINNSFTSIEQVTGQAELMDAAAYEAFTQTEG